MMRNSKRAAVILAAASSAVGIARNIHAANLTWAASPATSFWNAANWLTGGAPATPTPVTDTLLFGTSSVTTVNNDFAPGTSFAGITFNSGASAFSLSGNSVNFTGGIVANQAGTTETINFAFNAAGTIAMGTDQ